MSQQDYSVLYDNLQGTDPQYDWVVTVKRCCDGETRRESVSGNLIIAQQAATRLKKELAA